MDKNKFWHGDRPFNTASPRLGTPMQRKARRQYGCPNTTQGTSASWAPQHNARHIRKLGTPTQVRNANSRHVRKLGAPTQRKARLQVGRPNVRPQRNHKAHPQVGHPNAIQGTSARWAPKRKTDPQRWANKHNTRLINTTQG